MGRRELRGWSVDAHRRLLPPEHGTFDAPSCTKGGSTAGFCSGDLNWESFVVDYTFNKHFDVYAGVSTSNVAGGYANGFTHDKETTNAITGLRLKF